MRMFKGKLRNGGDANMETFLPSVSAAAVHVLRGMHGPDSVVIFAELGEDRRSDRHHRKVLNKWFGDDKVRQHVGTPLTPLPRDLPEGVSVRGTYELAAAAVDEADEDEEEELPPVVAPPAKQPPAAPPAK